MKDLTVGEFDSAGAEIDQDFLQPQAPHMYMFGEADLDFQRAGRKHELDVGAGAHALDANRLAFREAMARQAGVRAIV